MGERAAVCSRNDDGQVSCGATTDCIDVETDEEAVTRWNRRDGLKPIIDDLKFALDQHSPRDMYQIVKDLHERLCDEV